MNRRFHLYPDNEMQQRLSLSASLVNVHRLEGFDEAISPFEVEISEAPDRMIVGSHQELVVRPPIPKDKLAAFGDVLVKFAKSHGLEGQNKVLFIDHSDARDDIPSTLTDEYRHLATMLGPHYLREAK